MLRGRNTYTRIHICCSINIKGSDIEKVVQEVEARYEVEWNRALSDSPESEECYKVGEEILQKIKDIEWEVQDVSDSVATLEANPESFSLGPSELKLRKEFIQSIRARLDRMKSTIMQAHNHVTQLRCVNKSTSTFCF